MNTSWLTIADAAAQLGVSHKTIRRYLHTGKLLGQQAPTSHGPQWYIDPQSLEPLDTPGQTPGRTIEIIPPDPDSTPGQILNRLTTTILELQTELHDQQATLHQIAETLAQLHETLNQPSPPRRWHWPWQ